MNQQPSTPPPAAAGGAAPPRRWLITGANSGLGLAFARAALAGGDFVVAAVRRPESMDALKHLYPERILAVTLDVGNPDQCQRAVEDALSAHGQIDVLVNNAGYALVGAVEENTEGELRDLFEVLFFGPMRLTQLVLPHMRSRGSGTIVQVTSMGGMVTFPGYSAYCAAKGALEQAAECLALEVEPLGIRVLIVQPGNFRTEIGGPSSRASRIIPDYDTTAGATRAALVSLHRTQPGDPDKAAQALLAVLDKPAPPLRLPLGDDAVSLIRLKLDRLANDLASAESLCLRTDFDA